MVFFKCIKSCKKNRNLSENVLLKKNVEYILWRFWTSKCLVETCYYYYNYYYSFVFIILIFFGGRGGGLLKLHDAMLIISREKKHNFDQKFVELGPT